ESNAVSAAASTSWSLPLTVRRILVCVIRHKPQRLGRHTKLGATIKFAYKRASRSYCDATACLLSGLRRKQTDFLFGNGIYAPKGSLTGLGPTRNIVRTLMKSTGIETLL